MSVQSTLNSHPFIKFRLFCISDRLYEILWFIRMLHTLYNDIITFFLTHYQFEYFNVSLDFSVILEIYKMTSNTLKYSNFLCIKTFYVILLLYSVRNVRYRRFIIFVEILITCTRNRTLSSFYSLLWFFSNNLCFINKIISWSLKAWPALYWQHSTASASTEFPTLSYDNFVFFGQKCLQILLISSNVDIHCANLFAL